MIAGRFRIESLLGEGGMGRVYRARDEETGRLVAVKVLQDASHGTMHAERFVEEARVLASLRHENVVAYVAHGVAADGSLYLAMELLEGEELDLRLDRGPLPLDQVVTIGKQLASVLDEAHRQGIIHRDIKPSNLFLRGGDPGRLVVLDFGIARQGAGRSLTRTGAIVGTPEYMAPEQAQGARDIGPAADLFSLGVVLYQALSGVPPFVGEHVVATLAKIVFEEPPPLSNHRSDVPPALEALVMQCLAKAPARRPRSAQEVLSALSVLDLHQGGEVPRRTADTGLGTAELVLISIVIASLHAGETDDTVDAMSPQNEGPSGELLRQLAARGVPAERLADGSLVVHVVHRSGSAIDHAVEAAQAAQLVRASWPAASVVMATARGVPGGSLPIGDALERASALLRRASPSSPGVLLDEVTAGLLGGRLRTSRTTEGGLCLDEQSTAVDELRPLLGKPTPCVGREQELGMLDLTLSSCLDERESRAVMIVAPPGLGKSRIKREFLRRAGVRSEPLLLAEARGEPLRAGTSYGLIAQLFRGLLGFPEPLARPLDEAQLLAHARARLGDPEARDVAALAGELNGVPFADDDSLRLRSARQDPKLLQAFLCEVLVALLRSACEQGGALLLLEDLHWGDRLSLDLVGRLLRELPAEPVLVVGFCRPELLETTPDLWKGKVTTLPLRPLGRRACEKLIERVAGDRLDRAQIARLAERADGNALFLEELVRAACEAPGTDDAPETVLAMLQARIGRLGPGERRTLRAASVFGERFSLAGVSAVLGRATQPTEALSLLRQLVVEELLEPLAGRDPADGEGDEYRFRHALMRDAAYGLLTDDDRRLGHSLAGSFLAEREQDPGVVAEHFARAGEPRLAGPWFVKAAQLAFDRDDFSELGVIASRARAAGVQGEERAMLASLDAFVSLLRWQWDLAVERVTEALASLRSGSRYHYHALRAAGSLSAYRNDLVWLREVVEAILAGTPEPEARLICCEAILHLVSSTAQVGLLDLTRRLLDHVDQTLSPELHAYPTLLAWRHAVTSTFIRHSHDDLAPQLSLLREALALYEMVRHQGHIVLFVRDALGEVECRAGQSSRGEDRIRSAIAFASKLGGLLQSHARLALCNALLSHEQPAARHEAETLARELIETPGISDGYQAMARDALAHSMIASGDLVSAEREARTAIALSPHTPVRRWLMSAHLTLALTRQGRAVEAAHAGLEALAEVDRTSFGGGYAETPLLLACAEATAAVGDHERTSALLDRVRQRCARQLEGLDAEAQQMLLAHLRENTSRFHPVLRDLLP